MHKIINYNCLQKYFKNYFACLYFYNISKTSMHEYLCDKDYYEHVFKF